MRRVTPEQHMAAMAANLPLHTGHTLDEWIARVQATGLPDQKEQTAWLRAQGLGRDQAMTVLETIARRSGYVEPGPDEYLAGQYSGAKAALLPIYDALKAALLAAGPGVAVEPRKTSVSVFRDRQLAVITAATKTRVDLHLALPGAQATARLQEAKSPPGRCTHVVGLTGPEQVDAELQGWLVEAYAAAGPGR